MENNEKDLVEVIQDSKKDLNNPDKTIQETTLESQLNPNKNLLNTWIKRIKRHGKLFVISFLSLFLLFQGCSYINYYMTMKKSVKHEMEVFIEEWTNGDTEALAKRFGTDEIYFKIDTGFNNNALTDIMTKTTYQGTKLTIKDVSLYISFDKKEPTVGQARILVETYDNMAILEKLFNSILEDKSVITHNYNEKALINKHIIALENDLKGYPQDFKDVQIFTIKWDKESNSWDWDLDENYEGINSVSGNMFEYMKKIGVSE